MSIVTRAIWLALWVGIPVVVLWRVVLWIRRGRTELYFSVPAFSRATQPVLFWAHVALAGVVAILVAQFSIPRALVLSGLIKG